MGFDKQEKNARKCGSIPGRISTGAGWGAVAPVEISLSRFGRTERRE
jgi:hypothetical protein